MAARKSKKADRAPMRQKRAEVRTVEPEEIEEVKDGMGVEDDIVLTTTILLVGAIVLAVIAQGAYPA